MESVEEMPRNVALLWYKNSEGDFAVCPVRTGSSDGKLTELLSGPSLEEGMKVVTGWDSGETQKVGETMPGPPPGGRGMLRGPM